MRIRMFFMGLALVGLLLFSNSALAVTISVWHSLGGTNGDLFEEIVNDFRAENPDITVDLVYSGGYVATMEKTMSAFAGGAAPNIAQFEQTRSAALYYADALLNIDKFVHGPDGIDLTDFSPTMLGAVSYDGNLYGLPYNVSTPLLYYNKGLFSNSGLNPIPPKNSEELLAMSQKIVRDADGDGNRDVFGIDFYKWGWVFESWIGRYGARVLNDDLTEFTFNSPEAIKAMEFTQALVNEYQVATASYSYTNFWNGQLAMRELSTASLAKNIKAADENGVDMGVAPLPCETECYAPIGGGNFFLMNTGTSAEQEASWKFLKFITSTENYARFSAGSGYMAGRRSSINAPALTEKFATQPEFRATYEQLDVAYPRPKVPFWQSDVAPAITDFYTSQFKENGSVTNLLNEAVRKANIRLQEWRAEIGK